MIELKDFTCAYQWGELDKTITKIKIKYKNSKLYCVPSSDKDKIVTDIFCKDYLEVKIWSSCQIC